MNLGVNPGSYYMNAGSSFPNVKLPGHEAELHLTPRLWSWSSIPPRAFMECRGTTLWSTKWRALRRGTSSNTHSSWSIYSQLGNFTRGFSVLGTIASIKGIRPVTVMSRVWSSGWRGHEQGISEEGGSIFGNAVAAEHESGIQNM
jgi:hypothetical protein